MTGRQEFVRDVLVVPVTIFALACAMGAIILASQPSDEVVLVGTQCPGDSIVVSRQDEDGDDFIGCGRIEAHEIGS